MEEELPVVQILLLAEYLSSQFKMVYSFGWVYDNNQTFRFPGIQ